MKQNIISPIKAEVLEAKRIQIGCKEGFCPSCHGAALLDALMPVFDGHGRQISQQKVEGWCTVCGGSGKVNIVTYMEPVERN